MAVAPGRPAASSAPQAPVIPAWLAHPTDQRKLALALFVALQAWKVAACLAPSAGPMTVARWALVDIAFVIGVGALRIPRLSWSWSGRALLTGVLVGVVDWLVLAGGWRSIPYSALLPASVAQALTFYPTLSSSHARLSDVLKPKEHLSGAFELVITPFSTARILPQTAPLPCISDRTKKVPLALHFSTMPGTIEYALTLPASQGGETVLFNVSASALDEVKPRRSLEEAEALGAAEDDDDEDEAEVEALLAVRQGVAARQALTLAGDSSAAAKETASKGVTLLLPVDRPSSVRLSRVFPPAHGSSAGGHHSFRVPLAGNAPVRIYRCPSVSLIPQLPGGGGRIELDMHGSGQGLVKAAGSAFERCIGEKGTVDLVVRGEGGVTVGWTSVDGAGNKASGLLDGIGLDDPEATGAAADKSYLVPLPLTFDVAGRKTYSLTTLSSPHVPQLALEGQSVVYTVLPRPAVSFAPAMGCSADRPLVLLNPALVAHPKPDHLTVLSEPKTPLAGHPFRSTLSFTPAADNGERAELVLELARNLGQTSVRIDERGEGLWRIESVAVDGADGRCGGDVKEPRECRIVYAPAPKLVRYDIRKVEDDCAGEQGVTVSFVLLGQAPFRLRYTLTTTPFATAKNPHPRAETSRPMYETLTSNTGELTLLPKQEGEYVYAFEQLADRRYTDGVAIEPATVNGSVRPVAAADFGLRGDRRGRELRLWACEGQQVELDVVISSGSPPFALEFLTTTATSSTAETVTFATAGKHALTLPVPEALLRTGGNYSVGLAGVRDGNGCGRKLKKDPVAVEVRVGRPTAKIAGSPEERLAVVTEGKVVSVPLRLTGDGPWSISYQKSTLGKPIELKDIRVANPETLFDEAAAYKLLSVADAHCKGSIVPGQESFEIRHLPQPSVKLEVPEGAVSVTKRKSWKPKGVCLGEEDHVALHFQGQAPFEVGYTIRRPSKSLVHTDVHRDILRAVASSTTLALETDEPGHYTYSFDRVGDRNYGLSSMAGRALTFDHEVYGRPSARWLSTRRISLCAHSKLTPASLSGKEGLLALKGKAPFAVTLHITTPKSSQPFVRTIEEIPTDEWRIDLDDLEFSQLGLYTVSVESVADASGCAQDLMGEGVEDAKAFKVEVAETASIVQVQKGEDVCVGQSLDFLLQGTSPWSLTTSFDGKERRVTQKDGKFSLLADKPGAFAITSISHQRNQCQTPVTDVVRRVHALPSARVRAGDRYVETVEEGEQAEIVFAFEGEPPFSFTYTRSTSGRLPTVLETHTVSGITGELYSIFASAEGVWQVTEVEDRWCRFPPLAAARPDARPASLLEGIEVFPPIRVP